MSFRIKNGKRSNIPLWRSYRRDSSPYLYMCYVEGVCEHSDLSIVGVFARSGEWSGVIAHKALFHNES
jgi:hypothetical protein